MIGQSSASKEEKWKMTSMYGFHRLEQGLSKWPFPHASDWSTSGHNCKPFSDELFGYLPKVPSNTTNYEWSREDNFCQLIQRTSLCEVLQLNGASKVVSMVKQQLAPPHSTLTGLRRVLSLDKNYFMNGDRDNRPPCRLTYIQSPTFFKNR